ncbi:helix-turn-helix domain containing protein [Telmatobacter sp. DSM 110680]|uniref:Helix-turn-helix domain containing protein n=1 Tax=Telmatobacter sp. DSM 110680 TaxID=3036704 RepID=A0AAU7DGK3_9BACT
MPKVNAQGFAEARLDTWKSIAQYLGRSTRTVQRWHSEYRLPIRHLGGDATSVFAYTDELDEWLRKRNPAENQEDTSRQELTNLYEDTRTVPLQLADSRQPTIFHGNSGSSERRASELVGLAQRMWESLSDLNLPSIVRLYREAADLDPFNAQAFAGLSQSLIAASVLGTLHSSEAYRSAEVAMHRALELDPELIETGCATAWLKLLVVRDWTSAGITFDEVLLKRPWCTQALVGRALLCIAEGRLSNAAELLREASTHRPLNSSVAALFCWQEYLAGDFDNALAFVSQSRATGHAGRILDAVEALAGVLIEGPVANIDRLAQQLEDSPRHYAQQGVLGYVYGVTGQSEKALAIIDAMTVIGISGKCDYAYSMALTFLGLNEHKAAMEWLQRSYLQGSLWSLGFQLDPILAPLRSDPQTRNSFESLGYAPSRIEE